MNKMTSRQEQKYLHQKLMYMLPNDVIIGSTWAPRFFNELSYKPRTLKQFIFAFEWLQKHRNLLPEGTIRFHGTYFAIRENEEAPLAFIGFKGAKLGYIEIFDEEKCSKLVSVCKKNNNFTWTFIG